MSEAIVCPVCQGRGEVPNGFYNYIGATTTCHTAPEQCRSCNGHGYLVIQESTGFTVTADFGEHK